MYCKHCHLSIPDHSTICPHCGEKQETTYRGNMNRNHAKEYVGSNKTTQPDTSYRGGINSKYAREDVGHSSRPRKAAEPAGSQQAEQKKTEYTEPKKPQQTEPKKTQTPEPEVSFHSYWKEPWYVRLRDSIVELYYWLPWKKILPVVGIFLCVLCIGLYQEKNVPENEQISQESESAAVSTIPIIHADESFMLHRDNGFCRKLSGDIGILFIFVDDSESSWSQNDISVFMENAENRLNVLKTEAQNWSVPLSFATGYRQTSFDGYINSNNAMNLASILLSKIGLDFSEINTTVSQTLGTSQGFPVFVANKNGRAMATQSDSTLFPEYIFLYKDPYALCHEMCHIFGAEDYYYIEEMEDLANIFLKNTIMLYHDEYVMDPLTAYLVGWTDILSDEASHFLTCISWYTQEDLLEAGKENSFTGYGNKETDEYTYEGGFLCGFFHGYGTQIFKNGNRYEGTYDNGCFSGNGKFTWADGSYYDGEWKDGHRTGYGTFYWNDGSFYEGEFLDGKLHGQGTLTYADGQKRSGKWDNDEFLG